MSKQEIFNYIFYLNNFLKKGVGGLRLLYLQDCHLWLQHFSRRFGSCMWGQCAVALLLQQLSRSASSCDLELGERGRLELDSVEKRYTISLAAISLNDDHRNETSWKAYVPYARYILPFISLARALNQFKYCSRSLVYACLVMEVITRHPFVEVIEKGKGLLEQNIIPS